MLLVLALLVNDAAEDRRKRGHLLQFLNACWKHHHQGQKEDDEEDLAISRLGRDISIASRSDTHDRVVDQIVEEANQIMQEADQILQETN